MTLAKSLLKLFGERIDKSPRSLHIELQLTFSNGSDPVTSLLICISDEVQSEAWQGASSDTAQFSVSDLKGVALHYEMNPVSELFASGKYSSYIRRRCITAFTMQYCRFHEFYSSNIDPSPFSTFL
jgi:hypothetical protein